MDPKLTLQALQNKTGCEDGDLHKHGIYKFTYLPTKDSYVGKAQRQSLYKRLVQHINKATSDRQLTGKVDELLRNDPKADNWGLKILPMENPYEVAKAEAIYIKKLEPSLNVQQPNVNQ